MADAFKKQTKLNEKASDTSPKTGSSSKKDLRQYLNYLRSFFRWMRERHFSGRICRF